MSFTWPSFLWLLLLVPLPLVLLRLSARRRQRTSQAFADPHLLPALVRRPSPARARWLTALQLAALGALLLAAARPVAAPPLPVNKAAVVIALDASLSMLADDVSPSRLEAARALAEAFVRQAPASTQIGLVSFSDAAAVLVAPTTDRQGLLDALERVEPASNTSLTAAIVTGVRVLPGRAQAEPPEALLPFGAAAPEAEALEPAENLPPGSIIILSDGADNVAINPALPTELSLDVAARFAADYEVKLHTLAIGRAGGAVTRIDGQDYFIPFEPRSLERLAELSGGEVLDPADEEALARVFRELGTAMRWEATEVEISSLLSGFGLVLMLIAGGLSLQVRRRVP